MDNIFISFTLLAIFSYTVGSLNSSIIFSKIFKMQDPRSYGSKNPGATNILRTGNKILAASILIIDILKGLFPTLLAYYFLENILYIQIIGIIAVIGHIFPVFYNFKGR